MSGLIFESLALRLMAEAAPAPAQSEESLLELQGVVLRLAIDRIDAAMKHIAQSPADAAMAQRYRAMQEKRTPLAAQLDALVKKMDTLSWHIHLVNEMNIWHTLHVHL
jgi:hypothetical protein